MANLFWQNVGRAVKKSNKFPFLAEHPESAAALAFCVVDVPVGVVGAVLVAPVPGEIVAVDKLGGESCARRQSPAVPARGSKD